MTGVSNIGARGVWYKLKHTHWRSQIIAFAVAVVKQHSSLKNTCSFADALALILGHSNDKDAVLISSGWNSPTRANEIVAEITWVVTLVLGYMPLVLGHL